MTGVRIVALLLAMMFAGAIDALAQRPPGAGVGDVDIRGYAMLGLQRFTAEQTFDASLGSPDGEIFGGGVRVD
ncbi:MAG TPA: hypothetical protein VFV51_16605, partial [Vicinamibacterales bacterium]|nr:hypothetical protein [Vicinamibacterales bacterium]